MCIFNGKFKIYIFGGKFKMYIFCAGNSKCIFAGKFKIFQNHVFAPNFAIYRVLISIFYANFLGIGRRNVHATQWSSSG